MDKFIEASLQDACANEGLSDQTRLAIHALLNKKLTNNINDAELASELENIYQLIIGDKN